MQKCKSIAPPKRNSGNIPSTRHKIQFHRQQQAKNIIDHESQKHRITFTTTGGTYPFLKINKYFFYTRSRTAFMFRFFSVSGLSGFHVDQGFTRDFAYRWIFPSRRMFKKNFKIFSDFDFTMCSVFPDSILVVVVTGQPIFDTIHEPVCSILYPSRNAYH